MRILPDILKTAVHGLGRQYINKINEGEASSQISEDITGTRWNCASFSSCMIQCDPSRFSTWARARRRCRALLASCGYVVTAIDNIRDYWPNGMVNRHWHVQNDDITKPDNPNKTSI